MYKITARCVSCYTCVSICSAKAIRMGFPCVINTNKCQSCGKCAEACPVDAIVPVTAEKPGLEK